jgi:tryptophanase
MREGGYKHDSLGSIAREMFSYADGCTMSSKKDGLVNIGGFLALQDEGVYREAQQHLVLLEGFLTYGGLAGRDLEAIARGLREVLQEDYMANRVRQVHLLGNTMAEAGLPVFQPIGGHSVLLDMKQFLSHLPQDEYPAEAFTSHIYLDSGTRTVGLGQLAFGGEDAETGERIYSPLEVVRMAVPRRLYTDNHILLAARSAIRLYEARELIPGMRLKWAPPALRHFTAHLEPTGPISSEI